MQKKIILTVYVEGRTDKSVIEAVFRAASFYEYADIDIVILGGKKQIASQLEGVQNQGNVKYAALIDADEISVIDSRATARRQLGMPSVDVFCAVPTIESWVFADPKFAKEVARTAHGIQLIDRAPLPETIPHPKQFSRYAFGKSWRIAPTTTMNIDVAAARSPSLRAFVEGIAKLVGRELALSFPVSEVSDTRDIVSTLLLELPESKIVWRTISGESVNAGKLATAIAEGSPLGNQYATELLRVARDLIARKADK